MKPAEEKQKYYSQAKQINENRHKAEEDDTKEREIKVVEDQNEINVNRISSLDSTNSEAKKKMVCTKHNGMLWKTLKQDDESDDKKKDWCSLCWEQQSSNSSNGVCQKPFELPHEMKKQFHQMFLYGGIESQFKQCLETKWFPKDYPFYALENFMEYFSPLDMCMNPLLKIRFFHVTRHSYED